VRRIYGAGLDESLHSLGYDGAGEANAVGVLQDKVRNEVAIGGNGRKKLTSLQSVIAEFQEQLTRTQFPGPGPTLQGTSRPLR
jgi:hypothetical protein